MEEKSVFKMTTRELRTYIKQLTPEVNERYKSYQDALTKGAMTAKPIIEERRERLVSLGTGKVTKRGVGLGLTYKNKPELIQQARALEEFLNIDVWTPAAKSEAESDTYKAFQSFKKTTRTSLNYQEYKDLTEAFGAIGAHVLNEFGIYNVIKVYEESSEEKRRDLVHEMNEIVKESKGQGKTGEDLIDELRKRMDL